MGIKKELNDNLREKTRLIKPNEISAKSGINQPRVSTWRSGLDFGIQSLERVANAFDYEIKAVIKVKV